MKKGAGRRYPYDVSGVTWTHSSACCKGCVETGRCPSIGDQMLQLLEEDCLGNHVLSTDLYGKVRAIRTLSLSCDLISRLQRSLGVGVRAPRS